MTTVFIKTLKPFITMSQIIGLMNFGCALKSGLLHRNLNSTYYLFLEIIRIFVFLICSYHIIFNMGRYYIMLQFNVIQYWMLIITARISEKCMIKFINGVIIFDRKLLSFDQSLPAAGRLSMLSKPFWIVIIVGFFAYFTALQVKFALKYTIEHIKFTHVVDNLFHSPNMVVFVVMITSCFFLYNLGSRFCALNRLWTCLPTGLTSLQGGLTYSEVTALVERIRLLHADLSELLRLFSLAYGPVLLVYFTLCFSHSLLQLFYILVFKDFNVKLGFVPYVFYVQYIVFTVSILYLTSWVIEKVKVFMNQVSIYEANELSAFGLFIYGLNLVLSICVLMVTGIATLIQMKTHPVLIHLNNIMKPQFKSKSP